MKSSLDTQLRDCELPVFAWTCGSRIGRSRPEEANPALLTELAA